MTENLPILVSHLLCPYVQRVRIALEEKGIPYEVVYVDLARKPDWFLALSPLGKTPILQIGTAAIFESAVILEYLEETYPAPLHPADPLTRAEHRAWIEMASSVLGNIAGFYAAKDKAVFAQKIEALTAGFSRIENQLTGSTYFAGEDFSLVDAAFAPVFRYFNLFDVIGDFGILSGKPKVSAWRKALAARPSAQAAVTADYPDLLWQFLLDRQSHLSSLMTGSPVPVRAAL